MDTRAIWSKNLEFLLKERHVERPVFAAAIGVSTPTLHEWINGGISMLKANNLDKVCSYFGIDSSTFLNHDLSVTVANEPNLKWGLHRKALQIREIPVTDRISGALNQGPAEVVAPDVRIGIVMYPTRSSTAFAVQIDTDEYRPRYKRREILIVDPSVLAEPGHEVLVILKNGDKLPRILDWSRGGLIQLSDVNEMNQPFTIEEGLVQTMYRIVGAAQADSLLPY